MRRFVFLLAVTLLAGSCRSHRDPARTKPNPPAPERAKVPAIHLEVQPLGTAAAKLTLVGLPDLSRRDVTDAVYTVSWRKNGAPVFSPRPAELYTSIVVPAGIQYADVATIETWAVAVTAFDELGTADAATATTTISLRAPCIEHLWRPGESVQRWYVDCNGEHVFTAAVSAPVPAGDTAAKAFLAKETAARFLQPASAAALASARTFFNGVATRWLQGAEDASAQIADMLCNDYPLLGTACVHGYFGDVDNDSEQTIFEYAPESVTFSIERRAGAWWLTVGMQQAELDVLFEPPASATLTDLPNDLSDPAYSPEGDLSAYIKAFGRARAAFAAELVVDTSTPGVLRYALKSFRRTADYLPTLQPGPFCNNNLGTVYPVGVSASTAYPRPVTPPAPFLSGVPLYAGLVSDADGAGVFASYYAIDQTPYPHAVSSTTGGSGAGRDAIGLQTVAYEYDIANDRHSDNPNNCRRPADACTVAGVQDGGPEWTGASASCEYPNVSNDGDDATYRISRLLIPGPSICVTMEGSCPSLSRDIARLLNYLY